MPEGLRGWWRYCNGACEYSFQHRNPPRIKGMPTLLRILSFSDELQDYCKYLLARAEKLLGAYKGELGNMC